MASGNVYGGQFCARDENQITTIGTGYIANFAADGEGKRAGATLTNKRIYFSGSVYTRDSKGRFVSYEQRKIVNIRDVTGTGYDFYRPLHWITWSIVSIIVSIAGFMMSPESDLFTMFGVIGLVLFLVFISTYFSTRMTLLSVEYAGGNIAFNVRWIQAHEQDDFIRNIHLAKDKLYGKPDSGQSVVNAAQADDEIPEL